MPFQQGDELFRLAIDAEKGNVVRVKAPLVHPCSGADVPDQFARAAFDLDDEKVRGRQHQEAPVIKIPDGGKLRFKER